VNCFLARKPGTTTRDFVVELLEEGLSANATNRCSSAIALLLFEFYTYQQDPNSHSILRVRINLVID